MDRLQKALIFSLASSLQKNGLISLLRPIPNYIKDPYLYKRNHFFSNYNIWFEPSVYYRKKERKKKQKKKNNHNFFIIFNFVFPKKFFFLTTKGGVGNGDQTELNTSGQSVKFWIMGKKSENRPNYGWVYCNLP